MIPVATEAKTPSMQAFGWFAALYTGASVLGLAGLVWLLAVSWLAS